MTPGSGRRSQIYRRIWAEGIASPFTPKLLRVSFTAAQILAGHRKEIALRRPRPPCLFVTRSNMEPNTCYTCELDRAKIGTAAEGDGMTRHPDSTV